MKLISLAIAGAALMMSSPASAAPTEDEASWCSTTAKIWVHFADFRERGFTEREQKTTLQESIEEGGGQPEQFTEWFILLRLVYKHSITLQQAEDMDHKILAKCLALQEQKRKYI